MFKNLKVSFFLASKFIRGGNKGTFVLTIIVMSLIFVNLIFMPSIISGIGETLKVQAINNVYGNIVIEPKDGETYINGADSIQKRINMLPGIVGTSSHYITGASFNYKNKFKGGSVISINPADEKTVTEVHNALIGGEYLGEYDTNDILLGISLAGVDGVETETQSLGGVKVGNRINVTFSNGATREYRVKGVFKTKDMMADEFAFITKKEMQSVSGLDNKASEIIVKISQLGNEKEFIKKFKEIGISDDIKTWREKTTFIDDIIVSFDLINIITTAVSLVMGIVVIFIVIYINTTARRRQIGILKAIGVDQNVIINSYVIQALFYCLSGIFLGSFLVYFMVSYMNENPIDFPMGYVRPLIEQQLIIQSIAGLIIVSVIAGFIPSWRTAKEGILKAIWG